MECFKKQDRMPIVRGLVGNIGSIGSESVKGQWGRIYRRSRALLGER